MWLLLLLLIGAGLLYLLHNHASSKKALYIQQDIQARTETNLAADGQFSQVSVHADGRDITLSGTVTNEEDKSSADMIATQTRGVRQVSNLINLTTPDDHDTPEELAAKVPEVSSTAKVEPLPDEFLPLEDETPTNNSTPQDEQITAAVEQLKSLDFNSITFEKNSSELTLQAKSTLDIAAKTLSDNPDVKIRIEGHTDSSGNPELNLTISQQRAKSVFDYFVTSGIDQSRMEFEGLGDKHPVASNDTAEGRIKNRRIEIKAINGE